ncbi:alpha-glucan family phosphorylase [Arthrobacter sp. zg-Y1171]|uniref:alpha-glucan family phosphorylase n=1 Tax=unclassified Arthrobacter TaxID=235627 RepID=UPI002107C88A|nr:alpha-glucan family phosphorylase [Arthrobacter sp. zg-Y1171]MCQ1948307.1 alpha-glucan family phosphorylase [Arthrobacter sp. zg-Y1116]MCQ1988029.1 alpha-glucan family phosphorylase [Arthrobacter sp. zg-Y844]MCQ1996684.1 alpha-glucan family phosphorylase [Arthrobacter sp. zg-Y1171]UWX82281.1 alpha-glucan family phosphorylase [Arthrobacter sp. zg-Y1171]
MKAIRRFTVRTVLPSSIAPLGKLASNLRWSWHQPTLRLFESIDPAAWKSSGGDPVKLLGTVSREKLESIAQDEHLVSVIADLGADLDKYLNEPRWYQGLGDDAPASIAYFSPEYGISAVLPQYSGGLGILAGDHLKAASDLGVPLVAVGLLYKAGYFKQALSRDGWQLETYPVLDPNALPLTLLREEDGTPARITLPLPDNRQLSAQIWRADVGRVPLLLLDSDVIGNDDAARGITDRLYGGGGDHRLQQELLLGMGGVKALRVHQRLTGAPPAEVFHSNEGHAGFLGVERIRELMDQGMTWEEALTVSRASTVFTTHTPVPAGIDRFEQTQIRHFFTAGLAQSVPTDKILALGAENYEGGDSTKFNMAVMGLRLAQRANGVAKLHGEVSREMFSGLWPGFDVSEVPITSVTNGVHVPTWIDPEVTALASEKFGVATVHDRDWGRAYELDDKDLWDLRRKLRSNLVHDVRRRVKRAWRRRGASDAELAWTQHVLDPDVLTIGFARRVPTYKRLTLMLRDPDRLKALLLHPTHPIQVVVAGKSHPADEQGKKMIQDLVRFTDDPEVRHRIVFLPNYDIAMAQTLFPGCDVWLNNPLRPLEASGTSGMKSAINGGLNLSILDGWWDEMFDGNNGWAIPSANPSKGTRTREVYNADQRDDIEAAALYDLLENSVGPMFYGTEPPAAAGAAGPSDPPTDSLPHEWLEMVKHTLADLGPNVSASRMLKDYVNRLYRPASSSGRSMAADGYTAAKELALWITRVRDGWSTVQVENVDSVGVSENPQIGDTLTVQAYVSLGSLRPEDVSVEAAYGMVTENDRISEHRIQELAPTEDLGSGRHLFTGTIRIEQAGPFGYTVRVLPRHSGLASKAELGLVVNA